MAQQKHLRATVRTAVTAALAGAGLLLQAAPASAADTTPPVLKAPVKAAFLVGGVVDAGTVPDCAPQDQPWDLSTWAPMTFRWSAADASGPVRYDVLAENAATGGDYVLEDSADTSLRDWGTTSDQSCGGGNWSTTRWQVDARDAAGNTATAYVGGGRMRLTQEDGRANTTSTYAVSPAVSYAGTWSTSRCTCWLAGAVRKTTAAGATVTATVPVAAGNVVHLALVMSQAPDRGRAKVYVDGLLSTTIDTGAAARRNRVIVWDKALGQGTHRVEVVNEGTAGRPRIDVDAFLTN